MTNPAPTTAVPEAATTAPTRPADPGALGLAAFALTTFVLSVANAGLMPSAASVLGLALFFGGIAQFAAGMWEFANKNTFSATAFCSFGAFWLAFWYLEATSAGADAGATGIGVFLLAWAIFTLYMTVAATKTTLAVLMVFVFLTLTFFALAIGTLSGSTVISHLGGWLGLVTAVVAWYGSFASVYNATAGRVVLPVKPLR